MKKFHTFGKLNFVDENNVFVGYDFTQCCCEDFDYHIYDEKGNEIQRDKEDELIADMVFDITFFEEENYGDGGKVKFKMTNGQKEFYLVLTNSHNGYYSHGFAFGNKDGTNYQIGCI